MSISPSLFDRALRVGVFVLLAFSPACKPVKHDDPPDADSKLVASPAPEPTFRFENGELRMDPARVVVTVPASWTATKEAPLSNISVLLRNNDGAMFMITAARRTPGSGAEATLRDVVEDKRKQYGAIEDVIFIQESVARFPAPTVVFTIRTQDRAVRTKVWMVGNKAYWIGFQCTGRVHDFPSAEAACKEIIDTFRVAER